MKKLSLFFFSLIICLPALSQTVFNFMAEKDNTVYSEDMNKSQGAGIDFIAGRNSNGDLRRALLKFDVSTIPNTATVTQVVLELNLNKVPSGAPFLSTVSLYALSQDWGEGTSNNAGSPGQGGTATSADCTWDYTFWSVSQWTNAGGDFGTTLLATNDVGSINGIKFWSGSNLTSKVQDWVDGTTPNNGIIMVGDETTNKTSKRFNSRENGTNPPKLIVTILGPTGLSNSVHDPRFSIIPNPVSDSFRINGNKEIKKLELFDLKGSKIKTFSPGLMEQNIKDLNRGIYLIKIQGAGFSITQKLIKN
jgi:Secretion system C-terminal sorting domain